MAFASRVSVVERRYPLREPFAISRGSRTEARVLVATVECDGAIGRGECVPYARYGETIESVANQIHGLKTPFDRMRLQRMLPAGAARNAVDCAMWDLEAKLSERRVWDLVEMSEMVPVTTACTISLGTPEEMRIAAESRAGYPILKVKLGAGSADVERLRAVREGAPAARIIVDANEGWNAEEFGTLARTFGELGVEMVEQPFPASEDCMLERCETPIAICADESCHDRKSLEGLAKGYSFVNIKLDKTGGLTEALALKRQAAVVGMKVMVGCMIGSSLAMAPATLVAQGADIVDLDGPMFLADDHPIRLHYEGCVIHPPVAELWG